MGKRQHQAERRIWHADYLAMCALNAALRPALAQARGAVLDIGCGRRPYQSWLTANVTRYIGLDRETHDASPHLVGDALQLPFASDYFDTVISMQTLEHLPQPFQACAEMARVLRPCGVLILTAPQGWREHEAPYDYFRFTRFGLRHLCEQAGLSVRRLEVAGTAWSHLGQTFLSIVVQTPLARLVAPLALAVNVASRGLDTIWPDDGDAINRLVIAEKPI